MNIDEQFRPNLVPEKNTEEHVQSREEIHQDLANKLEKEINTLKRQLEEISDFPVHREKKKIIRGRD